MVKLPKRERSGAKSSVLCGKFLGLDGEKQQMSRKAKVPIQLPKGVEVKVDGRKVVVKGPRGSLTQELIEGIVVKAESGKIAVTQEEVKSNESNFLGLSWALISNMVKGVSEGFEQKLEMIGVGYRAAVQGQLLDLQI